MYNFNLECHPHIAQRKPDLDPYQKGLLKRDKDWLKDKYIGETFEKEIAASISIKENDILLNNVYFETGNYVKELLLYESMQIDHMFISSDGVIIIEDKYMDTNKVKSVSGGASAKTWTIQGYNGKKLSRSNGVLQNQNHYDFIRALLQYNRIDVPIYQLTVIGGISREKIQVQQYIDTNLITREEIKERIEYLRSLDKNSTDTTAVKNVIDAWRSTDPGIEIQHIVYCNSLKRKKKKLQLPARCRKILRII